MAKGFDTIVGFNWQEETCRGYMHLNQEAITPLKYCQSFPRNNKI